MATREAFIRQEGTIRTLKVRDAIMNDAAGKPARMLGLDLDITHLKHLEEENLRLQLKQQKDLLLAILEAQEAERIKISESLHNGVGQILYATRLNLHQVEKAFRSNETQQVQGRAQGNSIIAD